MYQIMHDFRVRIMSAPAFTGAKVIAAILFERTMDGEAKGKPVPTFLWEDRGVVPIVKVDKGLEADKDGVQLMKPMPGLDGLLARAAKLGVFGTKMRSVINHASKTGIAAIVRQQFDIGEQIAGHGLVPIFHSHEMLLERADVTVPAARDLVLSVSAGLPKKSWPVLLAALDRLNEYERGIVVARSNGLEQTVTELGIMVSNLSKPPFLEVNLPRSEVFELLSRTSVLIYTLEDGLPVGMPMSLIEALCAGSCVVHPDREEFHSVVGPGFRPYRTVDDIVVHVREIMAGGPRIDEERRANRAWAVANFCDPELGRRFHTEISDALEAWRLANS